MDALTRTANQQHCSWAMKFGQYCEEACRELADLSNMPAFPYKSLKKRLKQVAESPAENPDPRQEFASFLTSQVQSVDEAWKRAARAVLKAERTSYATKLLAKVGVGRTPDAKLSQYLNEWASVARTGLRKIKKKYNKKLGGKYGVADESLVLDTAYAFMRSRERTEIETLARRHMNGNASEGAELADESAAEVVRMLECPVCLERLDNPVAPACGHAMCRGCHTEMINSRAARRINVVVVYMLLTPKNQAPPACPICRGPAAVVEKMPSLARAVRAASKSKRRR